MHTRRTSQSPPTSLQENEEGDCHWSKDDVEALIDFLVEHKAEAGDGGNFKAVVWTAVAQEMGKRTSKGAKKTAAKCKSKWERVCTSWAIPVSSWLICSPAQNRISDCYATQGSLWFLLG